MDFAWLESNSNSNLFGFQILNRIMINYEFEKIRILRKFQMNPLSEDDSLINERERSQLQDVL